MTRHSSIEEVAPIRLRTCTLLLILTLLTVLEAGMASTPPMNARPVAIEPPAYDLLILNGRVLDGSGNPWIRADIAVNAGRIAAIGDLSRATAQRVVDAAGLYVSPGFIDTHSHASGGLTDPELSAAGPLVAQGITTVFINPDGGGPVDLIRQQRELLNAGPGVNIAQFVPHTAIRVEVLGHEDRHPDEQELETMRDWVRKGMAAGAFGLSTGVFYPPASFAGREELIELARTAAEFGGVYQSHIRDEADYTIGVVASVDEVIEIARKAGTTGIVTHIKVLGPHVWGYSEALVHRIEQAREQGVQIFADQYPYTASSTGLAGALVPRWALDGGLNSFRERLENPELNRRSRKEMEKNLARRGGAGRIQFRTVATCRELEGKSLADAAWEAGKDPVDLAMELFRNDSPSIISFNMNDRDVERLMRQPWTMTSSDGGLTAPGHGIPHPRNYGTFPRKIRRYAVEKGTVDLAFAIRSMTHLPAQVYGIPDRGMIHIGAWADLAIFDLARLNDPTDFTNPHQLSEGVVYLFVNGEAAMEKGRLTGARNGQILRKTDPSDLPF